MTHALLLKYIIYLLSILIVKFCPVKLRISILTLTLCFILFETFLRTHDIFLNYKYPESLRADLVWEHDDLLGWKKKANDSKYSTSIKNKFRTKININSKGLRDDDYDYNKPTGVKRILLIGDSVVVGHEVEKEYLLDSILEKLLDKDGKYQVINAGTRGWGTDQSYLFLKTEAYKYNPDIIIYVFVANDPLNNITIRRPNEKYTKPYFTLNEEQNLTLRGLPIKKNINAAYSWELSEPNVENFYNQSLKRITKERRNFNLIDKNSTWELIKSDLLKTLSFRFILKKINQIDWLENFFSNLGIIKKKPPEVSENIEIPFNTPDFVIDYQWNITKKLLQQMSIFAEELKAKFLIYEFSSSRYDNFFPGKLENACKELEIEYLNSFDEFSSQEKGKYMFRFPEDGHWNQRGHALAAREIYKHLNKIHWLK